MASTKRNGFNYKEWLQLQGMASTKKEWFPLQGMASTKGNAFQYGQWFPLK